MTDRITHAAVYVAALVGCLTSLVVISTAGSLDAVRKGLQR